MPRYAVHPDDLAAGGALTAADGPGLDVVHRLVATAVDEAVAALGAEAPVLAAAVAGYGRVEGAVAATLHEAVEVLAGAMASAASAYARADSAAGAALTTTAGDGPP
jgi:hypothetical protein